LEEYAGVKFKTVIEKGDIGDVSEYLRMDRALEKYITPSGNEGNMSLRVKKGFLIKKAGTRMTSLTGNDVVLVKKVENGKVYAVGGIPSSESIMHYEIYKRRKEINIVLHFHDEELLKELKWKSVGPLPYGSRELADAVAESLSDTDRIKIEEHGFVVVAENREELFGIIRPLFHRSDIL
jgi:ribulose-5-phosphate 4-epimerase/fuculose-1-phosphate aldolase